MKIKAKNPNVSSMKLIVPVDGLVTVDGEGVVEVSEKCAEVLVKGTNDWNYLEGAAEVEGKTENDEAEDEVDDEEEVSEREKFEAHLDTLTFEQLKDLAKEGQMPEEEYKKLNSKKLMKAYLLKKFDESAEADDEVEDEAEDEVEE